MKYFTMEELCYTRHDVENKPNEEQKTALTILVNKVLDVAREKLQNPIMVTSGFRSEKLNKLVGGASSSQHCKGEAADLDCSDNKKLFDILSELEFDQLIWEKGDDKQPAWVHVSYKRIGKNRKQKLRTNDGRNYYSI